ncbi:MAG: hypothetical protein ACR2JQ_04735 [Mycobacteriales bacterium]
MIAAGGVLSPLAAEAREAGPIGLLVVILLCIALAFLGRSLITHLNRVPKSFDPPADPGPPDEQADSDAGHTTDGAA